ncbi:MAG: DUF4333 domain-containing protein [Ilumatobacteraceae bacterium]
MGGTMRRWRVLKALACTLFVTSVTGCGGAQSLDAKTVERKIQEQFESDFGTTPDVECAGNLKGTVGSSVLCTLWADGDQISATATTTAVHGSDVSFSIVVDN